MLLFKREKIKEMSKWIVNLLRGSFIAMLIAAIMLVLVAVPLRIGVPVIAGFSLLLLWIVSAHARSTLYTCKECSTSFKISGWLDFISPHWASTKLLRCPKCGATTWHRAQ